ncbi:MAG TPA: right-handed parallel beta-helix repeat-containing protein, partial [Burkholderiaceae bacterium]|nr:right-handed parallel beta-helix repeat-containing protein [Burkholderiaceae bacterium]
MHHSRALMAALFLFVAGPLGAQSGGRAIDLIPGSSFETAVESLQPGDTLVVHAGTYSDSGRISISVRGTASAPVLIKAADGQARPVITRPSGAAVQNTINVEGASYLTIKGLDIVGNGGDGINLSGGPSFITLEDLDIHDIDVGINFRSSMNNITVRRNHIRRTGIGNGTGEGMYVGCNDATCIVRDSLIEYNWIHDALPGTTQGDGIEIKVGSHSNLIRHNVIYNMTFPGIFVYGTGANPANVVEGNVIWNCLEGIYAVADAVVRNNIVIGSGTGLSLYSHAQVGQMKNVTAVNNTLYDNNDGLYVRWGSGVSNMVLANNAVYSPGKTAVNAGGGFGAGATVAANYVQGGSSITLDNTRLHAGGSAANTFVDAANKNFWPRAGSILLDRGAAAHAPGNDFNLTARVAPVDVGAYEALGLTANPGWRIVEGFKVAGGGGGGAVDNSAPSVAITAPSAGAGALAGVVSLLASAADNVAVSGVQFSLDGTPLGAELTSAPYSLAWDSTSVADGTHTLTAVARDISGNTTTS